MEIKEYTLMEYTFFIMASYTLLLSYYYQYKHILYYSNINTLDNFFNKDIILAQLNGLEKDFKTNKYAFWAYPFTIITICFIIYIFNLGNNLKHIWLGISIFLFIQYIIEYKFFLLKILIKRDKFTLKELLSFYEIDKKYENINFNNIQKEKLKNQNYDFLEKKDIINKNKDLINFINDLFNEENIRIEKSLYGFSFKNKKFETIEFDIEEKSFYKVIESESSYSKSFYEITNFEKIFVYGILETVFMSVLLFSILILK